MRAQRFAGIFLTFLLGFTSAASAAEHYVTTTGSASGDGTQAKPWDLATALSQPASVQAGDTIWLGGGTYAGTFTSSLVGTEAQPIVVRNAPGERVTIDGGDSGGDMIFSVGGAYTWYWGFEVMSSDPVRSTQSTGSAPTGIKRGGGVGTVQSSGTAKGVKFINLVVHDTAQGFSFWKDASDAEIYGCLIYYNGWDAPDRGHGHGIYTQNQLGKKTLRDNVLFAGFSYGIHAYGSDNAYLRGYAIEGNIIFDNGVLAQQNPGFKSNILLGGESGPNGYSIVADASVTNNATYSAQGTSLEGNNNVGYAAGCSANVSIDNNYFAQATALQLSSCSVAKISGNTLIGKVGGFAAGDYPSNTYHSAPPGENHVVVRKNQYEPGRAHLAIYNWKNESTVSVDVSAAGLASGSSYELRDVLDFWGTPVKTGTYDGAPISVPMTNLAPSAPVGTATPPHPAPRFGAFVLLGTAGPGGAAGAGGAGGGSSDGGGATTSGGSGGSSGSSGGSGAKAGSGGQAAASSDDDGGCGCRVAERSPATGLWLLIGLALLAKLRRPESSF